jgi:phosphohistidine phosphatase SixA
MLNLSLIRHARTDPDNSIHDDMSRSISLQGIDKTKKVCEFLKKKKISFDEVFCSPSKRTKETLIIIEKHLPKKPLVNYLDNLYYTSAIDIFDTVMLDAAIKRVLVVSNQPFLSNSIDNFF